MPINRMDLSRIKVRLQNIRKRVTDSVSYKPSDTPPFPTELRLDSELSCLEDPNQSYDLVPEQNQLINEWPIYAYDESVRTYNALEGDLVFCSSATIRLDEKYAFSMSVSPCFFTSIRKFEGATIEGVRYCDDINVARNLFIIENRNDIILNSVEPHSIMLIDGPLIGANITEYTIDLDRELRETDCIPVYVVKNSDSSTIIDKTVGLRNEFNSDFHWACKRLEVKSRSKMSKYRRSALFKYVFKGNKDWTKVFAYIRAIWNFPQRIEMHTLTYEKYRSLVPSLMNLIAYFYIAQGDYGNPQVRPIAIAEKYAREGLRIINIPSLLGKLGFHPSVNQVRFG